MKRIILTGGGTAGHVTPNIALLPSLKQRGFHADYVGQKSGLEQQLIETTGIPYHAIHTGKLRRYFDLKNIRDIFLVLLGFLEALVLVRKLRPSVIFSKGGYVSCPLVWAAWIFRIPVVIHESDITPGLANKLAAPFATQICFSFPETETHLPEGKVVYTGIPIRENLLQGDAAEGRKLCGFSDLTPIILVIGGSLGSEVINTVVREALSHLSDRFQVCHLCGKGKIAEEFNNYSGYRQFEYVRQELPHLLAMADLVVSRAGATTLFELLALRKANLLIPLSQKVSRGDQILNARSFEKQGFSRVLIEEKLSVETLIHEITTTFSKRETLTEAMKTTSAVNGVDKVLHVIQTYAA